MSEDVTELVARFQASPSADYTDAELELLDAAAATELWPAKIAGYQHFKRRNLPKAALLMTRVLAREPTP
jgi:hypothetical protein